MVRDTFAVVGLIFAGLMHAPAAAKAPDFEVVSKATSSYLAGQPDYRNGDLLSRSQIEGVLKSVAAAGWKVANSRDVAARGLSDDSFLVREFSTQAGKKFMRKVATQSGGFAHLDRLSTSPGGEKMVRYLISKPGGEDMIKYLATTRGGHNLGKMMGGVPNGVDLNKPTRGIYTAAELLGELQRLHNISGR